MPLPFLLAGAAIAAAGYGVKKGLDAQEKNEEAERIVRWAKIDFENKQEELEEYREYLNQKFKELARYKLEVFTKDFKEFVDFVKKCKDTKSKLDNEKLELGNLSLKELETTVNNSLEIASGLSKGISSGALTALGAYGTAGLLASASTGTAIASLSGAAATNATLAWFGGGSLAAGGLGMAGGAAVLGGIVAGPAIAITGLVMDSKAEENLTEAKEFEREANIKIEKMDKSLEEMKILSNAIDDLKHPIEKIRSRFNSIFDNFKNSYQPCYAMRVQTTESKMLISMALKLKELLDIPLLDKDGNRNLNIKSEVKKITEKVII